MSIILDKTCEKDLEESLERTLAELRQIKNLVNLAKQALDSNSKFEGLTLPGGIRALLKAYQEELDKNVSLSKELEKLRKNS
jgi:hypothetical protein